MVAVGSYMSYGSSFVDELYSESTIAVRWLVKDEPACHLHFLHSGKSTPKKTYFLGQHPKQGTGDPTHPPPVWHFGDFFSYWYWYVLQEERVMGRVAPGTSFPDLQMIYCPLTRIPQMITSHRLVRALTHQQLNDNLPSGNRKRKSIFTMLPLWMNLSPTD